MNGALVYLMLCKKKITWNFKGWRCDFGISYDADKKKYSTLGAQCTAQEAAIDKGLRWDVCVIYSASWHAEPRQEYNESGTRAMFSTANRQKIKLNISTEAELLDYMS